MGYKKQEILQIIREEFWGSPSAFGGTADAEYRRSVQLFEKIYKEQGLYFALAFLYDSQADLLGMLNALKPGKGKLSDIDPRLKKVEEVDSAGALGAMGAEGGGTYVTALDQTKQKKIYEVDTAGALGGGYSADNAKTGGFFIGPLGHIPRKELNKRLAYKDGKIVNKVNGQSVTEQMILEWFGGSNVKGYNAKPFWKGGKFVEINPKCLTFPYCSEGDSADKPIKLIGETKEMSSPCSWGIVEVIAETTRKSPQTIAKIIREHYLKLEKL